ncbi:MAG TPA: DUF4384 domain-containing protein [Polyangiales bacterium]|nr:DUF4384 domain-containing protein [Polyangiales bacterium]
MSGHLTRPQLEDLVADDPQARVPPQLRVHVADCDRCNVRRLALESARTRFMVAQPPKDFARAVVERAAIPASVEAIPSRKRHVLAPALVALAIAAAALLWLRPSQDPTAIRSKGGASLEVFAQHAGVQRALRDGEVVAPGDQLAFAYTLDRPQHLLLLGVDDAGQITRYFPVEAVGGSSLAAGSRAQLPVGVELDARKGDERLYALVSDGVVDELVVRDAVVRALAVERAHGGGIDSMAEIVVPGLAAQQTIWFRKP